MAKSKPSRIFNNGTASTLYVTIPAQVADDSQFPFRPDDEVVVHIDGDAISITHAEDSR